MKLFVEKYQPVYFRDFGLEHDFESLLETMIKNSKCNILLVGESSKTALLTAILNEYFAGEPRKDNVLYINSLKEQGVNYYRTDVKTFCQSRSNIKNKKKFVVLDDIDFINEQSQQVFRNCVDKYSNNVNFIASCTNVQKVIDSIQSRFVVLTIKPVETATILKLVDRIKTSEDIVIDDVAVDYILKLSNNNIKIILNYLEKMKLLGEPVTIDSVAKMSSNISYSAFEEYIQCIQTRNLTDAIRILYGIYDNGYSVMDILDNLFAFIKKTELLTEDQKYQFVKLICKYITMFHEIHEDEIELALFTNNLFSIIM